MNTKTQNPLNKVTKKETTKKVRLENEIVTNGINLLSSAKKNTKKEPKVKIKKVSFVCLNFFFYWNCVFSYHNIRRF